MLCFAKIDYNSTYLSCFVNAADDPGSAEQLDAELKHSLFTNIIPLVHYNITPADKQTTEYFKDASSNMIDNNSDLPDQFMHSSDSKGGNNIEGNENNFAENYENQRDNVDQFAIDKPIALMLSSRRKPLAYNGLDFGNIVVVSQV